MAKMERLREANPGNISLEELVRKTEQGWKLVALEWERPMAGEEPTADLFAEEIPYGVQASSDGQHLESNPHEHRILVAMMELLVKDMPLSHVACELNNRGYRTRDGYPWSQVTVYKMLPRLIQVSPKIYSSQEWEAHRRKLMRAV